MAALTKNKYLLHDPEIPILGEESGETSAYIRQKTHIRMFITVFSIVSQSDHNTNAHQEEDGLENCVNPCKAGKRNKALTQAATRVSLSDSQ